MTSTMMLVNPAVTLLSMEMVTNGSRSARQNGRPGPTRLKLRTFSGDGKAHSVLPKDLSEAKPNEHVNIRRAHCVGRTRWRAPTLKTAEARRAHSGTTGPLAWAHSKNGEYTEGPLWNHKTSSLGPR